MTTSARVSLLSLSLLSLLPVATGLAQGFALVEQGKPKAVIAIARSAGFSEQKAAGLPHPRGEHGQ